MVVYTFDPSPKEEEPGRSLWIENQQRLQSKFQASQSNSEILSKVCVCVGGGESYETLH